MTDIKINLDSILSEKLQPMLNKNPESYHSIEEMQKAPEWIVSIDAMKEACKQTLELAAENAKCERNGFGHDHLTGNVDKQSILDTIKQVE
jgi:hypothetical protein